MLLGVAPFVAEVLALAPLSGCHLIHAVVELVHADMDAVHGVVDVDVIFHLLPYLAVLFGAAAMALCSLLFVSSSIRASSSGDEPSCGPDILPKHRKVVLQLS